MGSIVQVTKEFQFDCAHLLTGHASLCKNLHGHTYKLQVELEGPLELEGPSEGMVIDFSHLKEIVKLNIVDCFDHAFIYWANAPEDSVEYKLAEVARRGGLRTVALQDRPTAENMSVMFYDIISKAFFGSQIKVASIKLWETPTSFAEYKG